MKQTLHLNRQKGPSSSGTRPSNVRPPGSKVPPTSEHDQRQRESTDEQEGAHGSNYGGLRRPPEPEDGKNRSPL